MKKISLPNTSEWINRFFDFLSRKASGKVLSAGDFLRGSVWRGCLSSPR